MPSQTTVKIPSCRKNFETILKNAAISTTPHFATPFCKPISLDENPDDLVGVQELTGELRSKALVFLYHDADSNGSSEFWRDEYQEAFDAIFAPFAENFSVALLKSIQDQTHHDYKYNPNPESIADVVKNIFIIDVVIENRYQMADFNELPNKLADYDLVQDLSGDMDLIRQWFLTENGAIAYAEIQDWKFGKHDGVAYF